MVKSTLSCGVYLKSLYDFKVFNTNVSMQSLLSYFPFGVFLSALVGSLGTFSKYATVGFLENFISLLFGSPLLLLVSFSFLYVFLRAFDSKISLGFWRGYLVFWAVVFPSLLVLQLLSSLMMFTYSNVLIILLSLLSMAVSVYLLVSVLSHLSFSFKTTKLRVFSSLLLTNVVFLVLLMFMFILYLSEYLTGSTF